MEILKLKDYISLQNTLFTWDSLKNLLPQPLSNYFEKTKNTHNHSTRNSESNGLFPPQVRTLRYGKNSLKYKSIQIWNDLQKKIKENILELKRSTAKKVVIDYFLNQYTK